MKNTVIFGGLLGLMLIGFSCAGGRETTIEKTPPFQVVVAYSQPWVAGTASGGKGTTLTLLITEPKEEIALTMVYFNDHWQTVKAHKNQPELFKAEFSDQADDPVIELISIEANVTLKASQAMIYYIKNGRPYFSLVNDIELRPILAYPGNKKGA